MFDERIVLSELEVAQGTLSKKIYLQIKLLDNGCSGIKLVLTDGEDVWKGNLSEDELDKLSSRLKMDFKKFVSQSVSALTREGLGDINYEYHLKALPADRMQLVWKKCVLEDDIKFQLGQVNLERLESTSQPITAMLNHCVTSISMLKKKIDSLETDYERLARDRTNAIKRLEKCVAAKTEMESELFSKFAAILNSKKEKIREILEEENAAIETARQDSPTASTSGTARGKRSAKTINTQPISSNREGSPFLADTDEEADPSPAKQTKPAMNIENSINLGEEEDEDAAPVARRPRRKAPAKKPSISKPILPKVSSSPSIGSRKSSLRKSGSGTSKSSENMDDLLDQM